MAQCYILPAFVLVILFIYCGHLDKGHNLYLALFVCLSYMVSRLQAQQLYNVIEADTLAS